ncbi:MAG: hypothetical protein HY677_02415 [Chloroflexi bacterium]|nr:hypothetical protein [Chloroflexota bacterium]
MASSQPAASVPAPLDGLLAAETDVASGLSVLSERLARAVASNASNEMVAIIERHVQATDRLAELARASSAQLAGQSGEGGQEVVASGTVGLGAQLLETLAGLAELNHRNLQLLGGAMTAMRSYLSFVSGFTREGRTYRGDGHARDAWQGRPSAIDRHI